MLKKMFVVALMVIGIPIGTWAIGVTCSREPAIAWSQNLSEAQKAAILPHAAEMPTQYLAEFQHTLSPEQALSIWQRALTQLPYPSEKYPQTAARDAAIAHYKSVLTVETFRPKDNTIRTPADEARAKDVDNLKSEIFAAFDKEMLLRMTVGAGQLPHYDRRGLPEGQSIAYLRTKLPKSAPWHFVAYAREVAADIATLHARLDDCNCDSYWGCLIDCDREAGPGICNWTTWGCGIFLQDPCYGICTGPPPPGRDR